MIGADAQVLEALTRLDSETVLVEWLKANESHEVKEVFSGLPADQRDIRIGRGQVLRELNKLIGEARRTLEQVRKQERSRAPAV